MKSDKLYILCIDQKKLLSKTDPHRLLLNSSDKINLKRWDEYIYIAFTTEIYIYIYIYKTYKNNNNKKLKISAPSWYKKSE